MAEVITPLETGVSPSNPYVGPQQFDAGHANYYFGRDREARDLLSVVIAHRLVLFYAPSGAGKSSLLRVRLIPGLRSKDVGYLVLPLARVGGAPPEDVGPIDNIYAFNVMSSIDGRSNMYRVFSHMTVKEFMRGLRTSDGMAYSYDADVAAARAAQEPQEAAQTAGRSRRSQPPHVLILDQLEEIVTTHATRWPERKQFFDQINEALEDDPQLWVVLSMRSDYVAEIEHYAPELPNYTFVRFAMEHLDKEAGREAVEKPAAKAGRPIEADAVGEIVHNLLLVREHGKEDAEASEGPFVQPVQLQVVCYQMWEGLQKNRKPTITIEDLRELAGGDLTRFVDNALGDFYEERLRQALQEVGQGISEAELRSWFSNKLITTAKTRGFLYKGETETEDIPNRVVEFLENKYLLRVEAKASSYWYELVHDRFIEPIRARNSEWEKKELQRDPLLGRAHSWVKSKGTGPAQRDQHLLLSDDELANLDMRGRAPEPVVQEFIEASQQAKKDRDLAAARQQEQAARQQERAARQRSFVFAGLFVLALLASIVAATQAMRAGSESKSAVNAAATAVAAQATSDANAVIAEAERKKAVAARRRAEIAIKTARSLELANQSLDASSFSIEDALLLASAATTYSPTLLANSALLGALDYSHRLSEDDPTIAVYVPSERLDFTGSRPWQAVAFSNDGRLLALSDDQGGISLWDNSSGEPIGQRMQEHQDYPVETLAFDPTGPRLISATGDRNNPTAPRHDLVLWDLADPEAPTHQALASGQPSIWSAAWSPDGQRLAVANQDGTVDLWELSGTEPVSRTLPGRHDDWAFSVAFAPDGDRLASAGKDGVILLWSELSSRTPVSQTLTDQLDWVNAVAFSPDGTRLASGSDDGALRLWDLTQESPSSIVLDDHYDMGAEVWDLAFTADGRQLAAGWGDWFVRVYDLEQPDAAPWRLAGHQEEVSDLAFDPAAPQRLVSLETGGYDFAPIAWDLGRRSEFASVQPFSAPVTATLQAMSPNGLWLALASNSQTVFVGETMAGSPAISFTTGMTTTITAAALSANGDRLAYATCKEIPGEAPPGPSSTATVTKTLDTSQAAAPAGAKPTRCRLTIQSLDPYVPGPPTRTITFTQPIVAVAFRPQRPDQLAIALDSGEVQTHNLSITVTVNMPGRVPEIVDLAFASDGSKLAALGKSGLVTVWDWASQKPVEDYSFGDAEDDTAFDAIEFVHDDAWLALAFNNPQAGFASDTTQLELRERGSGQLVERFRLDSGQAVDLVVDPDGRSLIWVQPGGLARWPMDPATWLELACTRAGRNLNYEAWRVAFPAEAERDDTGTADICKYPLDVSFAEALVTEARTAIARCDPNQLAEGRELLQDAAQMPVHPPLRLDALPFTLDVLGQQALEYLQQPSGLYQQEAADCLSLAGEQLSAAGQTTFDPSQALSAGLNLVQAERLLADLQAGADPLAAAANTLEEILEANAPWPDDFLFDRARSLLPQAYYRLCQQGDVEGCQRFTNYADLLKYGDTVDGQYRAGFEEPRYFQGQRGQAVTIAMNAVDNAFDTLVRLEGPEGVLTSDDDNGPDANSLIDNYLLPMDGTYLIIPTAYSGEGSYLLSLQVRTPQPIALGVAESSTTDRNSLWQFDGQAGQLAAIAMDADDSSFDPYLRLLGPDLTELEADDDSGGNLNALIVATLPEDGLYYVNANGCCEDAPYTLRVFEPQPLPFDQPQTSTAVSDTLWVFAGAGSQVVDLAITPADPSQQPRLTLRNARGDYLGQGIVSPAAGSERIPAYVVPGDDRLLVQVGPRADQTPYTLTLTSIEAQPLALGQPVTSTTQAGPIWTFSGAAGQIVDITLNSARLTFDPVLRLLDASGREITSDDASGGDLNARIAAYILPVDGQYFVTPLPAGSPVSYTLTLAQATPQAITLGEAVTSTLRQDTLWAFDGAAGQPIDVDVAVDTGESPSVALWTETGQTLAWGGDYLRDADASSIDGYILPQAGRYFVGIGNLNQTTRYSLTLSEARTRPIQIGAVVASTTISDTLWTLDAAAGQALDIALSTTDGAFDPYLTVYAPNGINLARDDNSGADDDGSGYYDARISMFVAPTAGRYLVRAGRPGSPTPYTLSVLEQQAPEILLGETERSDTRTNELWQFAGQAGQVVDIDLSGWVSGVFDPYLTLLGPDGSRLAENGDIAGDDYNARIAGFLLPQTGAYYIQTGSSGSNAPYRLALRQRAPTPAALEPPLQVQQSGAYALALDQPAVLRISADQPVELTLVGPGGTVLASQAPAILSRLDAAGTYTVGVSFPAGEPARQLTFERVEAAPQLLDAEQESRGELSPGDTDLWIVPGSDQRAVRLTASAAGFTPVVELWAPGGERLAVGDEGGMLTSLLPAAGDALLSLRGPTVQASGPYTLTVEPIAAAPGPQACDLRSDASAYLPVRPGSTVTLSRQRPVNGDDGWNPAMSAYVGRTARVTSLADTDWQGCPVVWIDIDQGGNRWRVRDLVVME